MDSSLAPIDEILRRVTEIARRHVSPEHATVLDPTINLAEIGLDSLGIVSFMLDVESSFSIKFQEDMLHAAHFRDLLIVAHSVRSLLEASTPPLLD